MNKYIHTETYKIRVSEIDQQRVVTLPALLSLLQETSMQHIIKLKASVWDQSMHGLTWVLLRKRVEVNRYPKLGESIKIETYPSGFDKILAYRDYMVYDEKGNIIVKSSSTWALMNITTRRMLRIPDGFLQMETSPIEKALPRCKSKLEAYNDTKFLKNIEISRYNLDWNNHVNNTHYIEMIMEWLPESYSKRNVALVEYQCKKECFLGDILTSEWVEVSTDNTYHRLINQANEEVLIACVIWQ